MKFIAKNESIFDIVNKIIVVKTEMENTGFPHRLTEWNAAIFPWYFQEVVIILKYLKMHL